MKCSSLFKFLAGLLLVSQSAMGQDQNPSVSGAGAFEEYPVELYTGAPKVNVPIYSLPTRSKDISIDLSLNYHPSSVSEFNKGTGDAGRGWSLSCGGIIGRNIEGYPDEKTSWNLTTPAGNDYYYFNFCGYSGKFKVLPYGPAAITESTGLMMIIDVVYDITIPSNISAFKFYDDKGYIYTFAAVDKVMAVTSSFGNGSPVLINNSFQLTEIRDNNNKLLVSYNYTDHTKGSDTFKILNEILVDGYGKIQINMDYDSYSKNWAIIRGIAVKDVLGNTVRKFLFNYSQGYSGNYLQLDQLDISDYGDTEIQSYKMYYNNPAYPNAPVYGDESADRWGYPNHKPIGDCTYNGETFDIAVRNGPDNMKALTDPDFCYNGVLEKMTLPTGGCIIYEYEANAYSYADNILIDTPPSSPFNYFTDPAYAQSDHNYTKAILCQREEGTSFPNFFTVPLGASAVYVEFKGDLYTDGNLGGGSQTPKFRIKSETTQVYPAGSGTSFGSDCQGIYISLAPGGYTFELSNPNMTGKVKISIRTLKEFPEKSWLGGGIRIKKIGYFVEDEAQNHYHNPFNLTPTVPSREISFGYNLFSDQTISSGNLKTIDFEKPDYSDLVRYKNVTVKDSKTGGRTEYTFINDDYYDDNESTAFFATSNLLNKKIYDETGNLQLESEYTYIDSDGLPPLAITYPGWTAISKVVNKQHFPSGLVETKEEYGYNTNRNISEKKTYTSRSGDVQKLKYFHHSGNSIYSKNRNSEVERVEQYLNDDLLSVAQTVYSNVWYNPEHTVIVNKSYLPQQVQSAKGGNTLETKSRVNLYDEFSHPLEVQTENGTKKSMIWGYNNTLVIAEIENMAYSAIPTTLITDAQTYSNGPVGTLTEAQTEAELRNKLNALRNAPQLVNAFVTTYTYKPLVGVLSVTDPRGYTITTEYDASNRPVLAKDQDGNILTENQYHNKPN